MIEWAAAQPTEREEGKANGMREAAARVGCCVLCVFVGSWVVAACRLYNSSFFLLAPKGHLLATCKLSAIIPVDVLLARAIMTPADMAAGLFR